MRPTPATYRLLTAALVLACPWPGPTGQSLPSAAAPLRLDVQLASHAATSSREAELDSALGTALTNLADVVEVSVDEGPLADPETRLAWSLRRGNHTVLVGTEQRSGLTNCRVLPGTTTAPPLLRPLLRRFGFEARTGWLSVDVPAVLGNLAARPRDAGPVDEALMLGALACGELALFARPEADGSWLLTARGGGGLLLPAALILLAEAGATPEDATERPLTDDLEHWLLIARAAHGGERDEALRQLGRFEDLRAVEALEAALFDPGLRAEAALALAHIGTPEAVAALFHHASELDPGLVADAVWVALPEAARREAERRISAAIPTPTPTAVPVEPGPSTDWLLISRSLTVGCALGLLIAWALRSGRAPSRVSSPHPARQSGTRPSS